MGQRNVWVDVIRVVSILYIVGYWHLLGYANDIQVANVLTMGITITALSSFVMISGYFLGRRPVTWTKVALLDFYWQRFLRIYVPFAIAAVIFFVVLRISGTSLAKGLLGISMFEGPPPRTLWFACMIVVFYGIAPILIALRGNTFAFLLACLSFFALCLVIELLFSDLDWRIVLYFPCFAAGVWFAGSDHLTRLPTFMGLACASLVSAVLLVVMPLADIEFSALTAPWAISSSALLLALAVRAKPVESIGVITFLGAASYFMYLLHRPIYEVLLRIVGPTSDIAIVALLVLVGLPITIAVSWLLQAGYNWLLSSFPAIGRRRAA